MSVPRGGGPATMTTTAIDGEVRVELDNAALGLGIIASLSPADALEIADDLTEAAGAAAAWTPPPTV